MADKIVKVKVVGYEIRGEARICFWGGGEGDVAMDPVQFDHKPTRKEIADNVNDGQFGCQGIIEASVRLYEMHSNGGDVRIDEFEFDDPKELAMGIRGIEPR